MPTVHVCPLSKIGDTVRITGARSLVTLISAGTDVARPPTIASDRHLHLRMSDIVEPMEGQIMPAVQHVSDLIAFAQGWDRAAPLLIHCYAGVSRSTAAAYAIVCALRPEQGEDAIARRLRAASPTATPNRKIVGIADDLLRRRGRMVDAVAAIGTGQACYEGVEFELALA